MITCPDCGELAPDDAKFCNRCGRVLNEESRPAPLSCPTPLEAGAVLKGGLEIVELIHQTSVENRYRASRRFPDGRVRKFVVRERFAPAIERPQEGSDETREEAQPAEHAGERAAEDPAGPAAKTAELKPLEPAAQVRPASASSDDGEQLENPPETDQPRGSTDGGSVAPLEDESASLEAGAGSSEDVTVSSGGAEAERDTSVSVPDTGANAAPLVEADEVAVPEAPEDLGELFGRVLALSLTLHHPAFERALEGFAQNERVYLVYPDEELQPLSWAHQGDPVEEARAISAAIQVCQAVSYLNRHGLRLNDICPASVLLAPDGRIRMIGLDYVTNDDELAADPIFNDGYTAPEIYRGKKVDKRADLFSVGALLYTWLTGERIECETWRGEAGPIRFYPAHVVAPALEQALRRALVFDPADRWHSIDEFKAELIRLNSRIQPISAVMTDVGMIREHNEDSVMELEFRRDSQIDPAENFLYVVADGMGGAAAGETASAIAVQAVRDYVEPRVGGADGAEELGHLLSAALEEANARILDYQASHEESRGMGSTAVAALLRPPDAAVAWVGDSRAYLQRSGTLRQVTKDHSLVQRLIEIGQISPEEARHHEHKNVITRSLGARPQGPAGAEAVSLSLRRGDRLMLCSDGLTAHVDDDQISEILTRCREPREAVRELVVAANAGGGTDNISVIVVLMS